MDQRLQHKIQKQSFPFFYNFVKKKPENLQLKNGHFMTLPGHFFANYTKIFQKTEIQTVILRCLVGLNLNWIKSYDINYNFFWKLCFSILEEKNLNIQVSKLAIFLPFLVIFCQLPKYLSQNWDSDGHFEVLNEPKT